MMPERQAPQRVGFCFDCSDMLRGRPALIYCSSTNAEKAQRHKGDTASTAMMLERQARHEVFF